MLNLLALARKYFPRAQRRSVRRHDPLVVALLEDRSLLSTSIPLTSSAWTALGPNIVAPLAANNGSLTGQITAIAVDANNTNRIFVGSAGGGVWGSSDGGSSWSPLTANAPVGTSYIGSLAMDPDNTSVLYAGTGEANYTTVSYAGQGILKSTDGGQTWQLLGQQQFSGYSISKIVVDPEDSRTVFVAATHGALGTTGNDGIWRSSDAGLTWTNITSSTISGTLAFSDLTLDPQNEVLFAGVGEPGGDAANGVYMSIDPKDASPTWTLVSGLPSGPGVGRISLDTSARGASADQWAVISDTAGRCT
jgi:photosystem II stability/assembly factor-like uncharacterized protein